MLSDVSFDQNRHEVVDHECGRSSDPHGYVVMGIDVVVGPEVFQRCHDLSLQRGSEGALIDNPGVEARAFLDLVDQGIVNAIRMHSGGDQHRAPRGTLGGRQVCNRFD